MPESAVWGAASGASRYGWGAPLPRRQLRPHAVERRQRVRHAAQRAVQLPRLLAVCSRAQPRASAPLCGLVAPHGRTLNGHQPSSCRACSHCLPPACNVAAWEAARLAAHAQQRPARHITEAPGANFDAQTGSGWERGCSAACARPPRAQERLRGRLSARTVRGARLRGGGVGAAGRGEEALRLVHLVARVRQRALGRLQLLRSALRLPTRNGCCMSIAHARNAQGMHAAATQQQPAHPMTCSSAAMRLVILCQNLVSRPRLREAMPAARSGAWRREGGDRTVEQRADRLTGGRLRRAWAARALARRRARRARARAPASAAPASTLSWCTSCCSAHVRATRVPASQRRARNLPWRL